MLRCVMPCLHTRASGFRSALVEVLQLQWCLGTELVPDAASVCEPKIEVLVITRELSPAPW